MIYSFIHFSFIVAQVTSLHFLLLDRNVFHDVYWCCQWVIFFTTPLVISILYRHDINSMLLCAICNIASFVMLFIMITLDVSSTVLVVLFFLSTFTISLTSWCVFATMKTQSFSSAFGLIVGVFIHCYVSRQFIPISLTMQILFAVSFFVPLTLTMCNFDHQPLKVHISSVYWFYATVNRNLFCCALTYFLFMASVAIPHAISLYNPSDTYERMYFVFGVSGGMVWHSLFHYLCHPKSVIITLICLHTVLVGTWTLFDKNNFIVWFVLQGCICGVIIPVMRGLWKQYWDVEDINFGVAVFSVSTAFGIMAGTAISLLLQNNTSSSLSCAAISFLALSPILFVENKQLSIPTATDIIVPVELL